MTSAPAPLLAFAMALAWLAGVRVYLTVLAVGLAGAFGAIALPGALHALASPWVLGACLLLAGVEFVADKIPGFDSLWDLLHTPVRVAVGAWLGAAVLSADQQFASKALGICAACALCSHAIKTFSRRTINTSPEPLSNWSASVTEDIVSSVALVLLLVRPWLALGLTVGGSALIGAATVISFRSGPHHGTTRRMEATS